MAGEEVQDSGQSEGLRFCIGESEIGSQVTQGSAHIGERRERRAVAKAEVQVSGQTIFRIHFVFSVRSALFVPQIS